MEDGRQVRRRHESKGIAKAVGHPQGGRQTFRRTDHAEIQFVGFERREDFPAPLRRHAASDLGKMAEIGVEEAREISEPNTPRNAHANFRARSGELFTQALHGFLHTANEPGRLVKEKLAGAGFHQNSPAFFTWLGVVPYLTHDAIARTLEYISSIQKSEVVFDYMQSPDAFSEELKRSEIKRAEQLEKIGERSATRFEPAAIAAILRSHGLETIEDISFQEIASRFGRAMQGLAPGHAGLHVVHAKH